MGAGAVVGGGPSRADADLAAERHRRYLVTATPPIFHLVAAVTSWIGVFVAAFWALDAIDISYEDGVIVQDGQGHRFWIMAGAYLLAYVLTLFWITRLGTNAGTYGVDLVLWTFLPWWFPLAWLGPFGAILLIVAFLVILVWPFRLLMTKMCEAGGLPGWLAVCAWGPPLVPLFLIGAPDEYRFVAELVSGVASLFALLIPIIVTVIETIGIYQDRADDRARQAAKSATLGPAAR